DAPIHFAEGGLTVDKIPPQRLVSPVVLVDVSAKAAKDPDYRVTPQDLEAEEKARGAIARGALGHPAHGMGEALERPQGLLRRRHAGRRFAPALSGPLCGRGEAPRGARHLGGGLDTPSIDHGPSEDFIAHQILMGAGIYAIEDLARLDALPARGATLYALPMKIGGGSGAPARVLAVLP